MFERHAVLLIPTDILPMRARHAYAMLFLPDAALLPAGGFNIAARVI